MDHRAHSFKKLSTFLLVRLPKKDELIYCIKKTLYTLWTKTFLFYFLLILVLAMVYYYQKSKYEMKKDFQEIETNIHTFMDKQFTLLNYVGNSIVDRHLLHETKAISYFLRDLQNLSSISDATHLLNEATLIWVGNDSVPIGTLGPMKEGFKIDQIFLNKCSHLSKKILFSRIYQLHGSLEPSYLDACLNIVNQEGIKMGNLLLHFSLHNFFSQFIVPDILKKYGIILIDEDFNLISSSTLELPDNLLNKIKNERTEQIKYFTYGSQPSWYFKKSSFIPFSIAISPRETVNHIGIFSYFMVKAIILALLSYLIVQALDIWLKERLFYALYKMVTIFSKLYHLETISLHGADIKDKDNIHFIPHFKKILSTFKQKRKEANLTSQKLAILDHSLLEKDRLYQEEQLKFKIINDKIEKIKHYSLANFRFRQSIGEHFKVVLLNAITQCEMLIKEPLGSRILPINKEYAAHSIQEIKENLKRIFNLSLSTEKELLEPVALISDALSVVMLYALLRNIDIKTTIKSNIEKMYFNRIKFQIIIIGIVYQSIDATSKDGKILISAEKVLLKGESYLKILIEDDSYQIYNQPTNNGLLELESLTLENIKLLLDEEGGSLEIKHHLNKGKDVILLFPCQHEKDIFYQAGKNNVYPLF